MHDGCRDPTIYGRPTCRQCQVYPTGSSSPNTALQCHIHPREKLEGMSTRMTKGLGRQLIRPGRIEAWRCVSNAGGARITLAKAICFILQTVSARTD